jgi:hypothetical protein
MGHQWPDLRAGATWNGGRHWHPTAKAKAFPFLFNLDWETNPIDPHRRR